MKSIAAFLLLFCMLSCADNRRNHVAKLSSEIEDFELADSRLTIALVASEPLINTPIAMDIDNEGRLWVVEMPDYMPDIDGAKEDVAKGRIIILSDLDNDGYHEHSKVFMDSLHHPRAISLVYGGVLYATPPNLWFVDIENDQAARPILVDSAYALGGNIEHQPNGLLMNIDNWIYNAKSQYRYRRIENNWLKEPTSFRGQWGITHDAYGRLYYNDNSNGLYGDLVIPNTVIQNKHIVEPRGITNNLLIDRSIQPAHSTSVNRGYLDYMLDSNQVVKSMTSTCGPFFYQSENLGDEYLNNGFICVPEGNLIKRVSIENNDTTQEALNIYKETEWLRSTDEGFRPVHLHHTFDGSIYVVDMHRGVIQHNTYMTDYLRSEIIKKDLDTIIGQGRIFKIHNQSLPKDNSNIKSQSIGILISLLDHSNILIRKKAQHLLIRKAHTSTESLIYKKMEGFSELGKIHGLYVLEGLGLFNIKELQKQLTPSNTWFNRHLLVNLSKFTNEDNQDAALQLIKTLYNADPNNIYVGYALGKISKPELQEQREQLYQLYTKNNTSRLAAQMIIAGTKKNQSLINNFLDNNSSKNYKREYSKFKKAVKTNKVNAIYKTKEFSSDDKTRGRSLYISLCASCHNSDGKGINHLAPSLKGSKLIEEFPEGVVVTILNGLEGPVTVNGQIENYNTGMPGLKQNKTLTNEKIADLVGYINNSFRSRPYKITKEQVAKIRISSNDISKLLTEKEVIELTNTL